MNEDPILYNPFMNDINTIFLNYASVFCAYQGIPLIDLYTDSEGNSIPDSIPDISKQQPEEEE